jgi:signal peptidase I
MRIVSAVLGRKLVAVTVRGRSMEPTYSDGDRVLVRRDVTPAPGRVVVVERVLSDGGWADPPVPPASRTATMRERNWMIKRVVAAAGDAVPPGSVPGTLPGDRVPPGNVVLLGDNPHTSLDSRLTGYFPVERVLGAVLCRLARSPR